MRAFQEVISVIYPNDLDAYHLRIIQFLKDIVSRFPPAIERAVAIWCIILTKLDYKLVGQILPEGVVTLVSQLTVDNELEAPAMFSDIINTLYSLIVEQCDSFKAWFNKIPFMPELAFLSGNAKWRSIRVRLIIITCIFTIRHRGRLLSTP